MNLAEDVQLLNQIMIDHKHLDQIKQNETATNKQKQQEQMRSKLIHSQQAELFFEAIQNELEHVPLLHHADMRITAQPFLIKVDTSLMQIRASL